MHVWVYCVCILMDHLPEGFLFPNILHQITKLFLDGFPSRVSHSLICKVLEMLAQKKLFTGWSLFRILLQTQLDHGPKRFRPLNDVIQTRHFNGYNTIIHEK